MQCHKCNAEMEKGFILDEEYGCAYPLRWIEGDPGKSTLWRKLRGVIKRNKRKIIIETYRCTSCGFLELFANQDDKSIQTIIGSNIRNLKKMNK